PALLFRVLPSAHAAVAPTTHNIPARYWGFARSAILFLKISPVPHTPNNIPNPMIALNWSFFEDIRLNMTANNGIMEHNSAAIPLGMYFSAHVTPPLPNVNNRKPSNIWR